MEYNKPSSKLSVITINRNNVEGLRQTIKSVISQTFSDYEYIVIDGASTDSSLDVIKEYADEITYWVSELDSGIYNAMNKGIGVAKGEYLYFLNSGDWLYNENVLENVFSENRSEDFLYGNICFVKSDLNFHLTNYPKEISFLLFYSEGGLCHQAVFHKRHLFKDKLYNEHFKIYSDFEFFIQKIFFENYSSFFIDKVICNYDENGISATEDEKTLNIYAKERHQILTSFFPEKILQDYDLLVKYEQEARLTIMKRIRFIMNKPKLYVILRKTVKLIVLIASIFDRKKAN